MTTFISGLEEIEAAIAPREDSERPPVEYLSIPDGAPSVTVQPLQEFDPSSPAYREDKGLAFVTRYHQSPYNWKRSALCTYDSGQCLPCELNGQDIDEDGKARAWYPKKRFYINLIIFENGEPAGVKVFNCPTTGAGILGDLLEWYKTNGPISEQVFTLSRRGLKKDTNYTLTPNLKLKAVSVEDHAPWNAREGGMLEIPYDRQAKFYEYVPAAARAAAEESARSVSQIDW